MKKHKLWPRRYGMVIVLLVVIGALLGLVYVLSGFEEDVVGQPTDPVTSGSGEGTAQSAPAQTIPQPTRKQIQTPATGTAAPATASGPPRGTVPAGWSFIQPASGNEDVGHPYYIPFNKDRVDLTSANTFIHKDSGTTWTRTNDGHTLEGVRNNVPVGRYDVYGENYRALGYGSDGKTVTYAEINKVEVNPQLAQRVQLDAQTSDIDVRSESGVTYRRGTQEIDITRFRYSHGASNYPYIQEVERVLEPNKNPRIIRTTQTIPLAGGGESVWSTPGEFDISNPTALGSLTITGPNGERYAFSGVQQNSDFSYGSKDGPVYFDPADNKLHIGEENDILDRHIIQWDKNGDRIDTEIYDNGNIDERFIYHKNGDMSEVTFDGQAELYRQRYDPSGRMNRMTFENNDGFAYVEVGKYLKDKNADINNDGTITKDEAKNAGIPEGMWSTIDENGDKEISDILGSEDQAVLRIELKDDDTLGDVKEAQTETQSETGTDKHFKIFQSKNANDRFWQGESGFGYIGRIISYYQPHQALSNALFGDAYLNEWREKVDKFFAKKYLGVDHWTSEICRNEYDMQGDSVASVETNSGIFQFIGTVQADRSDAVPMLCDQNATCARGTCRIRDHVCTDSRGKIINEYFYKISYGVVAPNDQRLTPYYDEQGAISFNIVLSGPTKTAQIFTDFIQLKNGQSAANVVEDEARSPIMKYSPNTYTEICLVFGKRPVDRKGEKIGRVCRPIVSASGSFVNFRNTQGQAQTSQGPAVNTDW